MAGIDILVVELEHNDLTPNEINPVQFLQSYGLSLGLEDVVFILQPFSYVQSWTTLKAEFIGSD